VERLSGSLSLFDRLEEMIADFQGTGAALCLGNGYLANATVIPSLVGKKDAIFLDRLCHASIIDGVLLSGARFFRFRHNDPEHLEQLLNKNRRNYRRALIVIETVYSMDGDLAPFMEITGLKKQFEAMLMADEAHAIGIFGKKGEGIVAGDMPDKPEILVGTFGKALGSYGAFVACSKQVKDFLVNRCRGFIFSTALPPAVVAANLKSLEILSSAGPAREKVLDMASDLRKFIEHDLGVKTSGSSQIVPLILDDLAQTLSLEKYLFENGIFTRSIRPPTVPRNSPRIRFSITADHSTQDIQLLKKRLELFFSIN